MGEASGGGGVHAPRTTGSVPRERPAGPPPRPPLTSDLAPPAPHVVPRAPGTVRAAAWLWVAAVVAGAGALAAAAVDLSGVRQRLVDTAAAADPAADPELLRDGADTTVLAALGSLAVLVVLGLLVLVLYLRRRAVWSRVLVALGLLTVAVDVLVQDVVRGGPEADRVAVLVHAGLTVLALLLLLLGPSRRWSREPRG